MGSLRVRVAGGYVLECLRHLPNPPRMTSWCGVGFFNSSFGRALLEFPPSRSPASLYTFLYIDKNRPRTGSRYGVDFYVLRTRRLLTAGDVDHLVAVHNLHAGARLTGCVLGCCAQCLLVVIQAVPAFPGGVLDALGVQV